MMNGEDGGGGGGAGSGKPLVPESVNSAYVVHIDDSSSESKCGQCLDIGRQLKEVLMELSSAKLIIKLLQKEINMSACPMDSTNRTTSVAAKENFQEDSNENKRIVITFKHYNKATKPTNCNACRASPITTNQYVLFANLKRNLCNW
jgi:hypothetical protein